jgi:hypothetical protein
MSEETLIAGLDSRLDRYEWNALKAILYETLDQSKNRQVYEWVRRRASLEGHAILHYVSCRSILKEHRLLLPSEFERALVESIFFLLRVAEDAIAARQVNGFTRQAELFAIFHGKVRRWLLPFESRVVTPPQETGWFAKPAVRWPGVGEVYNAWPSVDRVVGLLKDECQAKRVDTHVKSNWSWCAYCSYEWIDTIHFGDIPSEIAATYLTNLQAA